MRGLPTVTLFMLVVASAAFAEVQVNTISTPGRATAEVSADEILIRFRLETEGDSFSAAVEVAEETARRLEKVSMPADGVTVTASYDTTFMQQKKWGRGSKLIYVFQMLIRNVADDKAQETLVHFVDSVLTAESRMTVDGYEARLSTARSQQVRDRLLREAVENARHNAAVVAESSSLKLGSPRSIVVGARPGQWSPEFDGEGVFERVTVRSSKAFSTISNLEAKVPVAVSVWAVFETGPL